MMRTSEHDEERLGELLSLLSPAPDAWVRAAQELPRARQEIDEIAARVEADKEFRAAVTADLEAAPLQNLQHALARRPRVGRRLQDDELAWTEARRDLPGCALDVREVGLPLLREGRRDGDEDRVGVGELVEVRGRAKPALDELREHFRRDVLDVTLAAVQPRDEVRLDVEEQD